MSPKHILFVEVVKVELSLLRCLGFSQDATQLSRETALLEGCTWYLLPSALCHGPKSPPERATNTTVLSYAQSPCGQMQTLGALGRSEVAFTVCT